MDGSTVRTADCQLLQSSNHQSNEHQHLKLNNNSANNEASLLNVPKRKLSVFYRSFDVIEAKDQENTLEFRRASSSPSVRLEVQDEGPKKKENHQETSLCKTGFVNCRSLIETSKFLSCSSPGCFREVSSSDPQRSPTKKSPVMAQKLPQLKESVVDNHTIVAEISSAKHVELKDNENNGPKSVDDKVAVSAEGNHFQFPTEAAAPFGASPENGGWEKKNFGSEQDQQADAASDGLVKIKDPTCPRAFVDVSGAGRGKYMAVGTEMSSHEDSSIGSESEEDAIETSPGNDDSERIKVTRSDDRSRPSSSFSIGEVPGKPDSTEAIDGGKPEDLVQLNREKRQRFFASRRSLSEGDCKRYHRARRHCGCSKQEESINEQDQFQAFPSFTDSRLQSMGLTNFDDSNNMCSENHVSSESEIERKYIAFSIGLGTDRITLHRRVMMSRRQRDLSEQNFANEIQKLQEEIEDLSRYSLYTDGESMERVERVRHRLDIVKTCAYRISSAAETLGAVLQEQRISPGICIADKYLQILRSRCENLSTEIAEIKRILSMHNIVIEEDSGEMYDTPLQPTRYRNGSSLNNRTVMARRRASIATISLKDCSRQRNSTSGRVTIRRPSWCSEMRWENDKQNRKDSSSVVELRDITEQTESRRNSREENNNLLRHDQADNIDITNRDVTDDAKDEDRLSSASTCLLESRIVEKQLVSCIRTAKPLRITGNFQTWRPILWYTLFFLLGFYVNYITLSVDASVADIS
ncbi:uncharacterized protein LOC116429118 isoform X2 [Nomia melanderi]|uniref:uncharacterized protein LOC116429118 isoform X2 n=1 Tax=Nomia melanderi TaxID=2448451 RepID=UPI001303F62B|nr:uncharacterized protein LOC116429118 isoform X2 [Nomia melanderi]